MRVKYRKLGREGRYGAYGLADAANETIELDPRMKKITHLRVLIHEALHVLNPDWSETKVDKHSRKLARLVWNQKYRRVEL